MCYCNPILRNVKCENCTDADIISHVNKSWRKVYEKQKTKLDKALAFIKRASLISYEIDGHPKHRRSYYLIEKEAEALLKELEGGRDET